MTVGMCANCGHLQSAHPNQFMCEGDDLSMCRCGKYIEARGVAVLYEIAPTAMEAKGENKGWFAVPRNMKFFRALRPGVDLVRIWDPEHRWRDSAREHYQGTNWTVEVVDAVQSRLRCSQNPGVPQVRRIVDMRPGASADVKPDATAIEALDAVPGW